MEWEKQNFEQKMLMDGSKHFVWKYRVTMFIALFESFHPQPLGLESKSIYYPAKPCLLNNKYKVKFLIFFF